MLGVTITLIPGGHADYSEALVRIAIWNTGTGSEAIADYRYRISHHLQSPAAVQAGRETGVYDPLPTELADDRIGTAWAAYDGEVRSWPRRRPVTDLLAEVLRVSGCMGGVGR